MRNPFLFLTRVARCIGNTLVTRFIASIHGCMPTRYRPILAGFLWFVLVSCGGIEAPFVSAINAPQAGDATQSALVADDSTEREIRVPMEDLPAILNGASQRIFMTREQYEAMLKNARLPVEAKLPEFAGVLSAEYSIVVHNGRADIRGELVIEVLRTGLQAIPLNVTRVGLLEATLDGKPALLSQGIPGGINQPHLLLEGKGLHRLQLRMVSVVTTDIAHQSLQLALPRSSASTWTMEVDGNVEIRSGIAVRKREFREDSNTTRFELLPPSVVDGAEFSTIVMSLNNRWMHDSRSVRCYSVILDELSETSETIQASMRVDVLNGALDRLELAIPSGFEVVQLSCPQMMRWSIAKIDETDDLQCIVEMRDAIRDQTVVTMQLTRSNPISFDTATTSWNWPILAPRQVQSHTAVLGLALENTLQCEAIEHGNLIAVDHAALQALFVTQSKAGVAQNRIVTSFYAPSPDQNWNARITREALRTKTQTYLVEAISNSGLEVRGSFHVQAMHESVAFLDVGLPKSWQISDASAEAGIKLRTEPLSSNTGDAANGSTLGLRTRIHLDRPIELNGQRTIYFVATSIPEGWLGEWQTNEVVVPKIEAIGVDNTKTFVATQVDDEIQLEITDSKGLAPLFESEKQQLGIKASEGSLAFRTDLADWNLKLNAIQKPSRVTAQSYSFLKFGSDEINANYEVHYQIQQGSVRELRFSLPESTPAELEIRGLGATSIKESTSTVENGRRIWRVTLMQRTSGTQKISIKFQQPLNNDAGLFAGPVLRAINVSYQTGAVAIEGDDELDVFIPNHPQSVDVGEFIDAEFAIGDRLIGTYGYSLSDPSVALDDKAADYVGIQISRRVLRSLPTTLAETLVMNTVIGVHGVSQHSASYRLRTTGEYIEIVLPTGSKLWSVMIDSAPVLPQRQSDRLIVELPSLKTGSPQSMESSSCQLLVVYELASQPIGVRTSQSFVAPQLLRRAETGDENIDGRRIPIVDSRWKIWLPPELQLANYESNLTLEANPTTPVFQVPAIELLPGQPARETRDSRPPTTFFQELESTKKNDVQSSFSLQTNADKPSAPPPQVAKPTVVNRLEGVRSLDVRLAVPTTSPAIALVGYGSEPFFEVTLVHSERINWLGAFTAGLVVCIGLICTRQINRRAFSYLLSLISIASIAPWITWWDVETSSFVNGIWLGLAALIAAWILNWSVSIARRLTEPASFNTVNPAKPIEAMQTSAANAVKASVLVLGTLFCMPTETAFSQDTTPPTAVASLDELMKLIKEGASQRVVTIPENAIVVPYESDANQPQRAEDKILVPYATYQRLWNAANPSRPLAAAPPPAEYSTSNLEYRVTLSDEANLRVEGQVVITQHVEQNILLSFGFDGGALLEVTLNDRPAQVKIVDKVLMLSTQGVGEKVLRFTMQFPVQRRGGWRVVDAKLPTAIANKLIVNQANTEAELRVLPRVDPLEFVKGVNKSIAETDLPSDGVISMQWRPKTVAEAVDQGLNLESITSARISEDGISIQWQVMLDFRRSQRDHFEFSVPMSVKVDQVLGSNIRGWKIQKEDDQQRLNVTLLKTAHQSETLTIVAHQSERLGRDAKTDESILLPALQCSEAMRHVGQVNLFHSALLELHVVQSEGLNRIDLPEGLAFPIQRGEQPIETKPFRSYRFSNASYRLELQAKETTAKFVVEHQTILRASRSETRLETRLMLNIKDRAIHYLDIEIPANWKPSARVANVNIQSSITQTTDGKSVIGIRFPVGQIGTVPIIVEASRPNIGQDTNQNSAQLLELPRIHVIGAESQRGDIAVQVDSGFNVTSEQLVDCEPCTMNCVSDWLLAEQQSITKMVLRCTGPMYGGTLRITPREPRVRALAISNIKLTQRSLEETIYLSWNIEDAGVDVLEFSLPKRMSDAKVLAQMTRRIRRIPSDSPEENLVRFQIELQDKVIGQYRVLVQRDSELPHEPQSAPIPTGITGEVQTRLITLENSGRDELLVDSTRALSPLVRGDTQWTELGALLGGNSAIAYRVDDRQNRASSLSLVPVSTDALRNQLELEKPELVYSTTERLAVETANARIGLAMTTLVVDQAGAYRAVQEYRIENAKEAYLELELPAGADLWTASVANRPVKPIHPDSKTSAIASDRLVRIPLVRTQLGDLDYGVVLKYAGKLPSTTILSKFDFPLIRTVNINVEQSQVRLHLPDTQYWYGFGGSLGRVEEEAEFLAGWLSFKNKQIDTLSQVINNSKDSFSKARAAANRRMLQSNVTETLGQQSHINNTQNRALMQQLAINSATNDALQTTNELQTTDQPLVETDNRYRFNSLFDTQSNGRANDQLRYANGNFEKQMSGDKLKSEPVNEDLTKALSKSEAIAGELLNKPDAEKFQNGIGRQKDSAPDADRNANWSFQQQARRYQQRLEQKGGNDMRGANQNAQLPPAGYAGGMPQNATSNAGASSGGGRSAGQLPSVGNNSVQLDNAGAAAPAAPGYMASLDIDIPMRGRTYLFATPRGQVVLTANGVSYDFAKRTIGLLGTLCVLGIAWGIRNRIVRKKSLAAKS